MAKNIRWTRRKFLAGLAAGVAGYGGYRYLAERERRSQAVNFTGPQGRLSELVDDANFDVCIIGSGPAGVSLGTDLANLGIKTLLLESGINMAEYGLDPRYNELDRFASSGGIDYPLASSRMRAVGGTSNIWTGRCARLHALDFEANAYTPAGAQWPISYAELEPYYTRAERTLRVRGGPLSAYHAARSGPLPLPPDMDIAGLKSLLGGVGVTVDDAPTSSGQSGPVRVAGDLLPAFAANRNARFITGATVTRLVPDASGRIIGAEVKDLDRNTRNVRARVFVLAGGGVSSPHLLLLSRSESFPRGIGNQHDLVGRYFNEHPNLNFHGTIAHSWSTLSPRYEIGRSHQFYDEFKLDGRGSIILVFTQSWVYPSDIDSLASGQVIGQMGELAKRIARAELRISATLEMEAVAANRVRLSRDERDYFGNPIPELHFDFSPRDTMTMAASRELIGRLYRKLGAEDVKELDLSWSHHHIGTCRMGDDPKTSVVDRNLKVHGCPNLYVLGSAVFVTGGASHPTLAILALSHRLGDHLKGKFKLGEVARHDAKGTVHSERSRNSPSSTPHSSLPGPV